MESSNTAGAGFPQAAAGAGEDYNFDHFRTRHLLSDIEATIESRGIGPGEPAPDFEMPLVGEGAIRLSDLRDKPVLLHFGSVT